MRLGWLAQAAFYFGENLGHGLRGLFDTFKTIDLRFCFTYTSRVKRATRRPELFQFVHRFPKTALRIHNSVVRVSLSRFRSGILARSGEGKMPSRQPAARRHYK